MKKFRNFFKIQNSILRSTSFLAYTLLAFNLSSSNLYWINGSGNWNDAAHWSITSGGASCSCIPTSTDDVFFDVNSFTSSKVVTLNVIASCNNMDWTGAALTPVLSGSLTLNIYGSLTLISAMSNSFTGPLYFQSNNAGTTITSAGKTFASNVYFNGTGDWALQDAFSTTGNINLTSGTLTTNNYNLTCGLFLSNNNNSRGLVLGSSLVTVTQDAGSGPVWDLRGSNYSISAGTSTIKFMDPNYPNLYAGSLDTYYNVIFQDVNTNASYTFINGGLSFNNVTFNGAGYTTTNGATFTSLSFQKAGTTNGNNNTYLAISFGLAGTINGNTNSFNNVSFPQLGTINGTYNSFNKVDFTLDGTITGGNHTFGKANFLQNATIGGSNTFDTLIFAAGKTVILTSGTTQTITDSLKADGTCSLPIILHSGTSGSQASISKASGSITVNYVQMEDINATGGATYTANYTSDIANNTGWTMTASASDLYWIGGSGNWNAPNHWSLTSGGPAACFIPNATTNVHFDVNSFTSSKVVTLNVIASCNNMDWTGAALSPVLSGSLTLNIYGSLTFITAMSNSFTGTLYFQSANAGTTITSAGKTFTGNVYFNGTGDWALQDAFSTTGNIYLTRGTLTTNNYNLTCGLFLSNNNNSRGLVLGSSLVTVSLDAGSGPVWDLRGSNYSLSAGTSTIKFLDPNYPNLYAGSLDTYYNVIFQDVNTNASYTFINGGISFNNVTFNGAGYTTTNGATFTSLKFLKAGTTNGNNNTYLAITFGLAGTINGNTNSFPSFIFPQLGTINGTYNSFNKVDFTLDGTITGGNHTFGKANFLQNATIGGSNTFDTLIFAAGKTVILSSGTTQTITDSLKADGTCSLPIILHSGTSGSQASISKASGSITVNYIQMEDINATGGATYTANYTSDIANNTGWTMASSASDLYWIGGSGNWNAPNHWSLTSGGPAACFIPNATTNVHFDVNSFTSSKVVTLNVIASCNNMDWTGAALSPVLSGSLTLNIYGSLTFITAMSNSFTGTLYFQTANAGTTITSAGKTFTGNVYFNGTGDWALQDAFSTTGNIYLTKGYLTTNNYNLTCGLFLSNNNNSRGLVLGSSLVTVSIDAGSGPVWDLRGSNYSLSAGTSTIKFLDPSYPNLYAGSLDTYYNVIFQDVNTSATYTFINGGLSFNNVTFNGAGYTTTTGASFASLKFMKAGTINGNNNTFTKVDFLQNGTLNGNNSFDSLLFSAGKMYTLQSTKTQTITDYLKADGTSGANLIIKSSSTSGQANISKESCTVCCSYLNLSYINAIGGAAFYAGNSSDLGNNSGWNFASCPASTIVLTQTKKNENCVNSNDGKAKVFASCGNIPYTYSWSSGGATTDSIVNLAPGTYTVTVTDNSGSTATQSVTIAPATPITLQTTPTSVTCFGSTDGTATVLAQGGSQPYTYSWNSSPIQTTATASNLITGTYTVTVTDNNNCIKTATATLVAPPVLTAGFTYSATGQTVTFTDTSQNATSFNWDFGDGNTGSQANLVYTYNFGGTYNVRLIATNSCTSDTTYQTITVICTPPVAGFTETINMLKVNFSNSSTNAATVNWNFGDGQTSSSINPTHIYFNSGTYTVCVVVINGCGSDSICQTITVTCAAPTALYTSVVSGMTVNFTNTSVNAAVSAWNFGDSQTSSVNSPSHIYNYPGTYSVKLKVSDACGSDSITLSVTVTCTLPMAAFVSNSQALSVDFVSTSTNATSFYWDFGDGSAPSILPFVNHIYNSTNTYQVCLIATNGCSPDTLCRNISVCVPPLASFTSSVSALTVTYTNTSTNGTSYFWTFGDAYASNQLNPINNYATSGIYTVCLKALNNCGSSTSCTNVTTVCAVNLEQDICLVTVDTLSTHNIIYWNKPVTTEIMAYNIYREITTNNYVLLASRPYDSISEYHDFDTVGTANPNVTQQRYVITAVDTCNNESVNSDFHLTIHLLVLSGGNLSWNLYDIENSGNPVNYYIVERDDYFTGNFQSISSTIPGGNTSYTDLSYASFPNAAYRVSTQWNISCSPTRAQVTTISNIKRPPGIVTGTQQQINEQLITVVPNPAQSTVEVRYPTDISSIEIYNGLGQLMVKTDAKGNLKQTFDISAFNTGLYQIKFIGDKGVVNKKIVKLD